MLRIHFSNRIELLAARLIAQIGRGGSVFAVDEVLIPNAAMQRWLTLAIADAQGICAQVRFGYLAPWLWQQVARVVPGAPPAAPPDPAVTAWRIHTRLCDAEFVGRHPRLAAHLRDGDAVMRFELAQRMATLFDSYATFRPDWLAAWREGSMPGALAAGDASRDDAAWQAALWQALGGDTAQALLEALAAQRSPRLAPPMPAVHVFALPTLAPLHQALLAELARFVPIELYLLNPCEAYWFDIADPRRLARLAARRQEAGHEVGHRLLAAWGRQTQSQLASLLDGWPDAAIEDEAYQANDADSLLARLQDSILALEEPAPGQWADIDAGDRSLELHCCHSLTRELEVLHDRLLGLFADDATLRACDVLVVLPELEAGAALIDAVFGTAPAARFIPYTISGRAASHENGVARALLELLALLAGRAGAAELFGWLQQPLVARRFGWSEDELLQLHEMLRTAGYRWGLDETQRERLGLPAERRHSLADAVERLFLGHALPDAADEDFAGLLPARHGDAGDQARVLGALWLFTQQILALAAAWAEPQTPGAAAALLRAAIADFLQPEGDEIDQALALQQALAALQRQAEEGAGAQALPPALWRAALTQQLDQAAHGGVPGGRVTFTAMSSLRSLPFAVVCVLGLNDGAFPGTARPPEFDLMQRAPRLGDRQRRDDDRNLFLDLLLAARSHLHLSYTGRSVRDNAPLPPSVLVADLLDLLLPAIADPPPSGDSLARARARVVVEHPLQPFSAAAFVVDGDVRRRSFHAELAAALRQATAAGPAPATEIALDADDDESGDSDDAGAQPFFVAALPAPDETWREVSIDELIAFLRNPCRAVLRRRLRLALQRDTEALPEDEPLVASRHDERALARRLLPALLRGEATERLRVLAAAGVELPVGALGRASSERTLGLLTPFAQRVAAATAEPLAPAHEPRLDVGIDGERWQLHGHYTDLRASGLVRWTAMPLFAQVRLEAWLHHLLLCAAAAPGVAASTRWITLDGELVLTASADAQARLGQLITLYRRGLSEPLHFFPRAAWAYIERGGDLEAARREWEGRDGQGERRDPAYRLALRGRTDVLDAEFEHLARTVFGPLHEQLKAPGT